MEGTPDSPPAKEKPAEAPEKEPIVPVPCLADAYYAWVDWNVPEKKGDNPLTVFNAKFDKLDPLLSLRSTMTIAQQKHCRALTNAYVTFKPIVSGLIVELQGKTEDELQRGKFGRKIEILSDELDKLLPLLVKFQKESDKHTGDDIPAHGDERDTGWSRMALRALDPQVLNAHFSTFSESLKKNPNPKGGETLALLPELQLLSILDLKIPPGGEKDPYLSGMRLMLYRKRDIVQGTFDVDLSLDDPSYVEKFMKKCGEVRTRLVAFRKLEAVYKKAADDFSEKPADFAARAETQQANAWTLLFPKAPEGQEEAWKGMATGWRQLREFVSVPLPEPAVNHPREDRQQLQILHKDHTENALPKLRAVIAYCSLYADRPKDFTDADRAEMSGIMTEELSHIQSYLARIYPHTPPDKRPTIAKFLAELPTIMICGAAMAGGEGSHVFHRHITLYDDPLFKALDKNAGVHRAVTVYTKHGSTLSLEGLQQYNTMAPHLQKQILQQVIDQVKGTNCVVILDGYAEASEIFAELQKALPKGQVLINCEEVLKKVPPEMRPYVQKGMAEAQSALLEKGMKPEQIASLLKNLKLERSIFMETMSHLKNMGINGGVAMMAILDIGTSPNKVDAAMKFGVMLGAIGLADTVIMDALLTKYLRAKLTGDAAKKAILRMNGMNPMLKMGIILGGCFLGHEWMEKHLFKPVTEALPDSSFRRTTEQILSYATFGSAWNDLALGKYVIGGDNPESFLAKFHAKSIDPRSDWMSILGMKDNDGDYMQNMVAFWNARVGEATDDKKKPKFVSKETAAAWKIVGTIDKQWANVRGAEMLTYSQEMALSIQKLKKMRKELTPESALATAVKEADFDAAMTNVLQTSLNDPAKAVPRLRNDQVVSEGFPGEKSLDLFRGEDRLGMFKTLSVVNRDWKIPLTTVLGIDRVKKIGDKDVKLPVSSRTEDMIMVEMKEEMGRFRGMAMHTSQMTSMLSAHDLPQTDPNKSPGKIYDYNRLFGSGDTKAARMECLMDKFAQDLLLRATNPSLEVSSKVINAAAPTGQVTPGVGTLIEGER